jgi:hypothetical protein
MRTLWFSSYASAAASTRDGDFFLASAAGTKARRASDKHRTGAGVFMVADGTDPSSLGRVNKLTERCSR